MRCNLQGKISGHKSVPGTKDSTLHVFEVAGSAGRAGAITTDGSLEAIWGILNGKSVTEERLNHE